MTREELIEVMARAMLADELTVRPTLTFDPTWQQESDIWLSNANAALAALEAAGLRLVPSEATKESEMSKDEKAVKPDEKWTNIGLIGNYYGGLCLKRENGACWWSIENYDGHDWEAIPESLYDELVRFNNADALLTARDAE